jgi:hypothetical protein
MYLKDLLAEKTIYVWKRENRGQLDHKFNIRYCTVRTKNGSCVDIAFVFLATSLLFLRLAFVIFYDLPEAPLFFWYWFRWLYLL